jgi:hypothetical protein
LAGAAVKRLVAFGVLGLAACLPGRSHPGTPRSAAPLGAPRVVPGELETKGLLEDLPARVQSAGGGPVSIVAGGEAYEGERLGAFVDVPADACLLAYARASKSVDDLDVAVFSDEGTPLAIDEAPDAHPTTMLCPPHPDRVYGAAHTASGEGLVAVAAQLVPKASAAAVGRVAGARGSTGEGPRPADSWPGLDEMVREHRKALGGAWEETRKVALSVDARAPTMTALILGADECADAVVFPSEDVALLDVEVLDDEGRTVARARESGKARTVTLCSPVAMSGSLAIRPHVGRGLAAVVIARAKGEVARDLTARPEIAWVAPAESLDAARSRKNDLLAKLGYDTASSTTNGLLTLGRRTSLTIDTRAIPARGCARIDVVGGSPLAYVDATLWTDAGKFVGAAEGASGVTLFACTHGTLRLDLETRGRPGPFTTLVRGERWNDAAFVATPLAAARMIARAATGPETVLPGKPATARSVSLDPSRVEAWTEAIAPGKCLSVAAGGQGDGTGLELRVLDATTLADLDRSHAHDAVGVRACAPDDAPVSARFELRVTSGKLDVVVGERTSP